MSDLALGFLWEREVRFGFPPFLVWFSEACARKNCQRREAQCVKSEDSSAKTFLSALISLHILARAKSLKGKSEV